MTARSQSVRALIETWQAGRHDDELIAELARLLDFDDLRRLFWLLRRRPEPTRRLELFSRVAERARRALSPTYCRLLVFGSDELGLDPDRPAGLDELDQLLTLDHLATLARERGDLDRSRALDARLLELLESREEAFLRHLVERRQVEDALEAGEAARARLALDRLIEGLPDLDGLRGFLEPGVELLRARLQELEDDPECLWSYLSLSRDPRLLEADRERAALCAAELMSQRHRIAGALALQLELVHGRVGSQVRLRALHGLVRDLIRGAEATAARSYAESLVEQIDPLDARSGEVLGMAALAAIRCGEPLAALDYLDRIATGGCNPALIALVEMIEAADRGDDRRAEARAEEILACPAPAGEPGPWRALLAVELLQHRRRLEADLEVRIRAAETVLREAAHARDLESMRDAYFALALLLAEIPENRDRAIAACREAETLTRTLLEGIDADRELLFKLMPRDNLIRTVVSSLMGRITEHARRSTTQLLELGASLARDAERGRELLEALRASQQRIARLLETLPIVVWTAWGRARDFALCSVEGAVESLFGADVETLRARPRSWLEAVHADDRDQVVAALARAEARLEGANVEFRLQRDATTDPCWVELHARPILGEPQEAGTLHGILSDVSERRLLQENIQRVQKVEGLGRLAAGVTHDFNNLLGSILSAATLLMQSMPEGDVHQELLQVIEKAAVRGTELVARLRGFARSEDEPYEILDLASLARETVELGRSLIGHEVELVFVGPDAPCWVRARRATMTQILLELLSNADEARPADRRILIELDDEGEPPQLKVTDRGCGMDYDTRARAFDPFFSTKDSRRHRGLGLTMVYKALAEMGGEVSISSREGRGSEVAITIPSSAPPAAGEVSEGGDLRDLLAEGRLLLIDDDAAILRVSEMILTQAGFEVVTARDGREGLQRYRAGPDDWALVVSDIRMPLCDGITLAREIRELSPGLPILLMSGYAEETPETQLLGLGAVALIRKPFTASAFLAAAGRLVGR